MKITRPGTIRVDAPDRTSFDIKAFGTSDPNYIELDMGDVIVYFEQQSRLLITDSASYSEPFEFDMHNFTFRKCSEDEWTM